MTPERWKQVEDVFQSALDLPLDERQKFIEQACAGDARLRAEVESLISQYEEAGDFIEAPAIHVTAFQQAIASPLGTTEVMLDADEMTGRRLGAYKIVREIGRGGMGTVHLAVRVDSEFNKRVAIKLVKRGMDTDFILRRFRNERQILASLDHPNIARLLDGGTTDDGLPYFIMEYIDGQPLYRYCDSQKLTIRERLRLFTQICSAVQYAHQNLVIHRDIKPGNILICPDGTAKLLDFGIAKLLNPELTPDTIAPTATAMRLMTPEYASPEQVRGETPTPASDIYSLGVLLYELLTGHRPYRFSNRSPQEIARVICEEEPEHPSHAVGSEDDILPTDAAVKESNTLEFICRIRGGTVEALRRELAGDIDSIILKALRKEPGRRYASVEAMREDILRHLDGRPISAPFFFPPAAAAKPSTGEPATSDKSIAVLPLKLLNPRKADETGDSYLGIGLADALITRLSNVRRFTVRPTSSVLRYSEGDGNPFAAGHALSVSYVVDGRIQRAGDRIRVTVQLLDVHGGAALWAGQFDEKYTDVLSLEDAISAQIAEAIVPHLTGDERQLLAKRATDNAEAFEAYLRGRYHWSAFTEEGFAKAITCYYRAIALDPTYAVAYTGIADYYNWIGIYGVMPPSECTAAAKEAASNAVELDATLAEAYTALGFAQLTNDFQWQEAERLHLRAIELNPNYATAHLWYSLQLSMEGRFDEAIPEAHRALELDPLSPFNRHNVNWCYYHARRFDESIAGYRKLIEAEPRYGMAHLSFSWVLRHTGHPEEALYESHKAVAILGDSPFVLAGLGASYAVTGDEDMARQILQKLHELSIKRYVSPYHLALVHCALREKERAFELLEETYELRDSWLVWLGVEPQFDLLRDDPRYTDILRRIKHPALDRLRRGADGAANVADTTLVVGREKLSSGDDVHDAQATQPNNLHAATSDIPPANISSVAPVHQSPEPAAIPSPVSTLKAAASTTQAVEARRTDAHASNHATANDEEIVALRPASVASPEGNVAATPNPRILLRVAVLLLVASVAVVSAVVFWRSSGKTPAVAVPGSPLRLTHEIATDWHPDYAPDGSRIVFSSNRDGKPEIYTMNADGSRVRRLTFNSTDDDCPVWSHDGKRIAFQSRRDGQTEIYVMNADGSNQINVTNNPSEDTRPAWSPDDTRIIYGSNSLDAPANYDIYTVQPDGSAKTKLTDDPAFDNDPALSPDGKRIAFTSDRDKNSYEIFVMNADGSDVRNISNHPGNDVKPVWSPDGQRIAFTSNRPAKTDLPVVYVMNADGSNQRAVSGEHSYDDEPGWSPDGRFVAFQSQRDGNWEVYVADASPPSPSSNASAAPKMRSIAVLPFTTIGASGDDQYLGVGLADVLTNKLGQLSEVTLRTSGAVRRYLGTSKSALDAGRELGVDFVLSGTVERGGERVIVALELTDMAQGRLLWAEKFDEHFTDISTLQNSISERVVRALSLELTTDERRRLAKRLTNDSEAQQLYLAGRYHWGKRTPEGLRQAIANFEQAIARDARFALAYAGLADCYALLNWYVEPAPADAWTHAREAALRAVEMDETLAEAHVSLAFVKFHFERDWKGAEQQFQRAINLNPNYPTAHHWYGFNLSALERHDEAIAEMRRAEELDPRSTVIATAVANVLYHARRFDEAIVQCQKALSLDPGSVGAHVVLRWAYEKKGMADAAFRIYEKERAFAGETPTTRAKHAHVLAASGQTEEARKVLEELLAKGGQRGVTPYEIAVIYALLGDRDRAFKWLAQSEREHAVGFSYVRVDPLLDNLRDDPRYAELLRSTGIMN